MLKSCGWSFLWISRAPAMFSMMLSPLVSMSIHCTSQMASATRAPIKTASVPRPKKKPSAAPVATRSAPMPAITKAERRRLLRICSHMGRVR